MKISVITATWNSEETIEATLRSLNTQDYSDIEHIIVDGASTDATLDSVRLHGDRVNAVISEKDNGIYEALNKGINAATGDVVGFLHSDDLYANQNVLSRIAKEFTNDGTDATYGDLDYVSKANINKIVRSWVSGGFDRSKMKNGWMPPHPTFYMRREHYVALGGFDLKYMIAADYDSMLRYLWKNKLNPSYIPEVLVKMRLGGKSNNSFSNILKKTSEDKNAMIENGIHPLRGLLGKNFSKISQFF